MNPHDYRRDYLLHVMAGYKFPASPAAWIEEQLRLRKGVHFAP
ncbi:MAG: hypothetical protein AVDCRST_MAG93-6260 [uncultured Chloroflexia bacterium]|uniref:Uncharacterized protein n=1 Tax=uncultured Chloroflexia bacterium TaxID=1672391 RepID=A0A6J4LHJ8_9CHLR|nr:MAG: hypothetical protein AVDCRST_MAG93-6260 [uncultured Chloroflexia bacterium]